MHRNGQRFKHAAVRRQKQRLSCPGAAHGELKRVNILQASPRAQARRSEPVEKLDPDDNEGQPLQTCRLFHSRTAASNDVPGMGRPMK